MGKAVLHSSSSGSHFFFADLDIFFCCGFDFFEFGGVALTRHPAMDAPVAEEAKASEESTDDGNGHVANGEGPPQAGRSEAGSGGAAESEGPAVLQRDTADPVAPGPATAAEERAEAEAADVPFIGAGAGDVDGRPGAGEAGETTAGEAPAPPPNEAAPPSADRTSENSTTDGSAQGVK